MALYLVRHAVAVSRSNWKGSYEDPRRPLTAKGQRQAKALVRLLGDTDTRRIWSSPAVRCVDSVIPLAETLGLEVHVTEALTEGHGVGKAVDLVHDLSTKKGSSLLCTHGDLVPEILRRLVRAGVVLESELLFAKGSTWELLVEDGRLVSGRYHPPAE
jgi:phosphohistidine phosphatase SixA